MPSRTPAQSNANNLKQSPIPVVPRTMPIVNSDGTVTRSGQLLLEQLQAPQTTYGPHADRPSATNAPNGSVYIETDRGSIYQNWNGVWRFITGTMWASLNPDQRPTDLGVNDGGFDFRTTDDPPREFIWSQAEWIEATPVRYGTHAARLAVVVAQVIDQLIWVETDRSTIYQLQNATTWQYLAGTMWGTLSPDQRPADLGTHDAGFDFRTTDQPPREFIWSQSEWIETTPIAGGQNLVHPNVVTKVGPSTNQIVEGGITDLSAGNSGSVNITAAGAVGIGTAAPGGKLTIDLGTAGISTLVSSVLLNAEYGSSSGGQGIDWSVNNSGFKEMRIVGALNSAGTTGELAFYTNANVTAANGTEKMRITGAGGVGIGLSNPTLLLQLSADSAGKPSTNTWTISSDIRTKQNVSRFEGDIGVIRKLDPIVAEYNGKAGTPAGARVVSFDAEKLREIVPPAVSSMRGKLNPEDSEETDLLGVNTHEIFFHMLRAIQYLDRQVEELKRR
jgi:hypothetical protein